MKGATSDAIIIPEAQGYMRVQANGLTDGYLDVLTYFSPSFTTTLLSEESVRKATGFKNEYNIQAMRKVFDVDEELLTKDLANDQHPDSFDDLLKYEKDSGYCKLISYHCRQTIGTLKSREPFVEAYVLLSH